MRLHDASATFLVVIDAQEKLLRSIPDHDDIIARIKRICRIAARLGVPILATEQYPQGLGPTTSALLPALSDGGAQWCVKATFSAWRDQAFARVLSARAARRHIVLCGVEAHVCVLQTAFDLQAAGYAVTVVAGAVGSRRHGDLERALRRLEAAGTQVATLEMVAFEWLERAGTPAFRDIAPWLRTPV